VERICYLYLCPAHGELSNAPIYADKPPPDRYCSSCLRLAEVWVGSALPAHSLLSADVGSLRETRRAQPGIAPLFV